MCRWVLVCDEDELLYDLELRIRRVLLCGCDGVVVANWEVLPPEYYLCSSGIATVMTLGDL